MALSLPTSYIYTETTPTALPVPIWMPEVPPDLCKGSANRVQSSSLELPRCSLAYAKIVQTERYELAQMPEVPPILCKDKHF